MVKVNWRAKNVRYRPMNFVHLKNICIYRHAFCMLLHLLGFWDQVR